MTNFDFYPVDGRAKYETYAAEYAFQQTEATPWSPLRRMVRKCRAALVVTAGLRLKTQHEYTQLSEGGSAESRQISIHVNPADLAVDFALYDLVEVEKDLNVVAPVDRLKDLVDREEIAGVHETLFSFYGDCADRYALSDHATSIGEKLRKADVDIAFLFPASHLCNQSLGLIARSMERTGLSTVSVSTIKEVTSQVKVPRAVFLNFPFGRTLGRAGDVDMQHKILAEMIRALKTLERPGRITEPALKWEGSVE